MQTKSHRLARWLFAPLMVIAVGATTLFAQVKDDAHIFGADAVQKADKIAAELRASHGKQVMLQSFAAVPDSERDAFKSQGKDKFFSDWAIAQAASNQVNGVYILVCMDPKHVQVAVGNKTQIKAFPAADRQQLSDLLIERLKAGNNDAALTEGFQFVSDRMKANLGASSPARSATEENQDRSYFPVGQSGSTGYPPARQNASGSPGMASLLCLGVGAVVVFFLIRGIFRRRGGVNTGNYAQGYNQPMGGAPYSGGGGGGGFGQGLLGGVLGGMLGGWGYDRLTRGGGQQGGGGAFGGSSGGDFGAPDSSGPDTSYTSGGGDFGGGGGDSGGGGGDSGGSSGGDF